jgi:hypothetical protein
MNFVVLQFCRATGTCRPTRTSPYLLLVVQLVLKYMYLYLLCFAFAGSLPRRGGQGGSFTSACGYPVVPSDGDGKQAMGCT